MRLRKFFINSHLIIKLSKKIKKIKSIKNNTEIKSLFELNWRDLILIRFKK